MFKRVTKTSTLVVGSLESDTGSEFLFGYDSVVGLKWLERRGKQYTAIDPEWKEAESFIVGVNTPQAAPEPIYPEPPLSYMEAESPEMAEVVARPSTVTRSSSAGEWNDPYPMEGDPRIVGDLSTEGIDIPDDNIAAQASQFLANLGEEE